MSSMPLPCRKPQFKETTKEPACQDTPGTWRSDANEKRRSLVVPTHAAILCTVTFLGTGGRFGQA